MRIIAHGIDLVDCRRIEAMLDKHGQHFLDRVFTQAEQAYAGRGRNRVERLAVRFAAKEAVFKLVGTGWRDRMAWTDIEVVNDPMGRPSVHLSGQVRRAADRMGIVQISISLTHTADLAIASVVALGNSHEDQGI